MTPDAAAAVYTDFGGLVELKRMARENSPAALQQVAQQFEAVFMQMVLKSMRSASLGEGILDSDQSKFYREMFDQQLALTLPQRHGLGLAESIVRQLGPVAATAGDGEPVAATAAVTNPLQVNRLRAAIDHALAELPPLNSTAEVENARAGTRFDYPAEFVQVMWTYADDIGTSLDVAPEAILAQAALESGWGQKIIAHPDGRSSYNLFGIKAGPEWTGDTVSVSTTEFVEGRPVIVTEKFRSYDSFAESFEDYHRFVSSDPRYQDVLSVGRHAPDFGPALQRAGYATDPEYGSKIIRILHSDTFQRSLAELKGDSYEPLI